VKTISSLAEQPWKTFHRWLSHQGNDFSAHSANTEFKYLCQIENNLNKSRVTGFGFCQKTGKKLPLSF
jgi:hypothetical protein